MSDDSDPFALDDEIAHIDRGGDVAGWTPAFPESPADHNGYEGRAGMTLRDYFAAKALQGYAANARVMDNAIDGWTESGGNREMCVAEYLAGLAYEVADAMLKAKNA